MAEDITITIGEETPAREERRPEFGRTSESKTSKPGEKRSFLKTPRGKLFLGLGAVLLGAAAAATYYYLGGSESTDDAQIDGYINPISSRVAGYVTNVYVDDNQYVKAGTLLVQIDPKDYGVALASAKATLANDRANAAASLVTVPITSVNTSSQLTSAEADVLNARAGISGAEKQLAAAEAAVVQAQANNAKAQDDVKRYEQLVGKEEIPQQMYVQAVQSANATEAAVQVTRANVLAEQDAVRQAQARLDQAFASVESARTAPQQVRVQQSHAAAAEAAAEKSMSAVEQAELNVGYTRIVAPVDGLVAKRSAQVGQYVAPGQELLAVVPLDDIWVTANLKETQLKNVRVGQPVQIDVDAYGRKYSGHVESIAGGTGSIFSLLPPENATGNYVKVVQRVPVRLRFDAGQDPEHLLRPGMSVVPEINVRAKPSIQAR
jgi:membrane fusion protein (multidrug efflux system)